MLNFNVVRAVFSLSGENSVLIELLFVDKSTTKYFICKQIVRKMSASDTVRNMKFKASQNPDG